MIRAQERSQPAQRRTLKITVIFMRSTEGRNGATWCHEKMVGQGTEPLQPQVSWMKMKDTGTPNEQNPQTAPPEEVSSPTVAGLTTPKETAFCGTPEGSFSLPSVLPHFGTWEKFFKRGCTAEWLAHYPLILCTPMRQGEPTLYTHPDYIFLGRVCGSQIKTDRGRPLRNLIKVKVGISILLFEVVRN